ncbi:MAG: HesA/MoeB/ThiF family protein [Bacteroidales bacterium]
MRQVSLTPRELRRYGKQIMLPELGVAGQEKLRNSSVVVIGAGGLGCPVLQYLAAAGVGKLGIVEFDRVDETNLQRQVLYGSNDVGKLKSIIARDRIAHLNSLVELKIINLRLDASNAPGILPEFDVVVDATDNFETRYLISDITASIGIPMVHGAIYMHEGQVSVFNYKNGPSYRNYNPEKDIKKFSNPLPSEVGLMGVLPGITGSLMANEVIKIITSTGDVLSGKLLVFNILDNSFRTININKDSDSH